jgi:hypothetical protein
MKTLALALLVSSFCILHSPARSASRSAAGGSLAAASFSEASAKDGTPNILLILPDQMRASAMGCDGNKEVKTPNIDRMAAEGILFNAPTPTCPCAVRRAPFS